MKNELVFRYFKFLSPTSVTSPQKVIVFCLKFAFVSCNVFFKIKSIGITDLIVQLLVH